MGNIKIRFFHIYVYIGFERYTNKTIVIYIFRGFEGAGNVLNRGPPDWFLGY
ncbi:hypothetical protein MM424_005099 [Salmonella enterica]|nr:hypothetical protein [Salmonella enterica]